MVQRPAIHQDRAGRTHDRWADTSSQRKVISSSFLRFSEPAHQESQTDCKKRLSRTLHDGQIAPAGDGIIAAGPALFGGPPRKTRQTINLDRLFPSNGAAQPSRSAHRRRRLRGLLSVNEVRVQPVNNESVVLRRGFTGSKKDEVSRLAKRGDRGLAPARCDKRQAGKPKPQHRPC